MYSIPPDRLSDQLKKLDKSMSITHGEYNLPVSCSVSDLDWNYLDQEHRPWIHHTYLESLRVSATPDTQLSINKMRIFGIPIFVQVTDMRVAPSVYYQSMTLFGVIYLHTLTFSLPGLMRGEWYILSHPIFKPFHYYIDRRMRKMNLIQNAEDVPVRDRRTELRKRGYGFIENPDFITANLKTNNVKYPPLEKPFRTSLSGLELKKTHTVSVGAVDLLIRPDGDGRYSVWNGVCPHEGGALASGKICGDDIQCPWHGLRFAS